MTDKKTILSQLAAMGAPRDSVVTVHSSLRAVGETEGRGDGFLDALIEYFTADGGLLVIPTHTWANFCSGSDICLDMNDWHTCIGTLPDLAAKRKEARRSEHPTHSVTVFGDSVRAGEFIAGDAFTGTCASPSGCYGKLFGDYGFVLLIGVGHNRNTFLHCVEEIIGVENRTAETASIVRVKRKDGSILNTSLRFVEAKGIGDVSARFPKLEPAFRYHGCIRDGIIGNAPSMLCDAAGMKNVMEMIYKRSGGTELLGDDMPLDKSLYS